MAAFEQFCERIGPQASCIAHIEFEAFRLDVAWPTIKVIANPVTIGFAICVIVRGHVVLLTFCSLFRFAVAVIPCYFQYKCFYKINNTV